VKTNIGHLESAAGIAGLIKIILMMKHRKFVPSLHFDAPNPSIDFKALNLSVTTKVADWPPKNGSPDLACVNSFGFGGTNVHAVIQEFNRTYSSGNSSDGLSRLWPVVFSAASPEALVATLKHTHDAIQQDNSPN
jgi:acyl transferase domain-containing protein